MALRYDCGEVITAMVTPMEKSGAIDYDKVESLAKHLIESGSDALLVAGTTGESPTLTNEEEIELVDSVKRAVANKAKIILGAGSNSTESAIEYTKFAQKEGVDAILSVVPYYNKPNQRGMIEHFSAVAEATDLPIILYNIPGRTGVNMLPETVAHLARKYNNIVGVKQSFGDMDQVTELRMLCPEDFVIYSGDDSLTLPMLSLGAHGVISVASHIFGSEIKSMIRNFKSGELIAARNMQKKLYPAFRKLFMAPNPTPVKAALSYKGYINDYVRKPLVTLTEEEKIDLFKVIDSVKAELNTEE
ncbi:4-hydroxy-tetrahydrodipicolinate synthase [bacterium]|nr:4-hydroxy-tetrahydrodipicolinate synthase [bacterium]MBO5446394.1 4-hydroxy-tetrahydrodipicolinate synthase [bacterium]